MSTDLYYPELYVDAPTTLHRAAKRCAPGGEDSGEEDMDLSPPVSPSYRIKSGSGLKMVIQSSPQPPNSNSSENSDCEIIPSLPKRRRSSSESSSDTTNNYEDIVKKEVVIKAEKLDVDLPFQTYNVKTGSVKSEVKDEQSDLAQETDAAVAGLLSVSAREEEDDERPAERPKYSSYMFSDSDSQVNNSSQDSATEVESAVGGLMAEMSPMPSPYDTPGNYNSQDANYNASGYSPSVSGSYRPADSGDILGEGAASSGNAGNNTNGNGEYESADDITMFGGVDNNDLNMSQDDLDAAIQSIL